MSAGRGGDHGYEVGGLNGQVRPGDTVAVVGAGPIGLAAMLGARLFSPGHIVAIDLADARLAAAKTLGADVAVNSGGEDAVARVQELTGGLGADVAIEAVVCRRPSIQRQSFPTHRFVLDEFLTAYDVFAHPAETSALKVVLNRPS